MLPNSDPRNSEIAMNNALERYRYCVVSADEVGRYGY
jgi:hypothetical protein